MAEMFPDNDRRGLKQVELPRASQKVLVGTKQ